MVVELSRRSFSSRSRKMRRLTRLATCGRLVLRVRVGLRHGDRWLLLSMLVWVWLSRARVLLLLRWLMRILRLLFVRRLMLHLRRLRLLGGPRVVRWGRVGIFSSSAC